MSPTILMAAPNGARKTRLDHQNLPVTVPQIIEEAIACQKAGAAMAHLHVRNQDQQHVLDSGLYTEVLNGIKEAIGNDLLVQITTEAVGRFSPQEQASCVKSVKPEAVSVALREMMPNGEEAHGSEFYHWAEEASVHVQHILYDARDFKRFLHLAQKGLIPKAQPSLLFVLGRYASDNLGKVEELTPFLKIKRDSEVIDFGPWFVCAFGHSEALCASEAITQGGHARVGFENNAYLKSGKEANSTAEIIAQTYNYVLAMGKTIATAQEARNLLGIS
ncbi:3-keto-5-aminohexanoate cleavage protein [Kiloniella sp. EL199]|uniref:3-keto-5-aminohexanoate cleavage protein n=1 Tax=Kiloniella sp. EL199 TaxID=2107581 RepID=UPI000EA1A1B2|nr:3-keto-5-aminohexanoate cleavage protein [Kiloniella sp. EL199]